MKRPAWILALGLVIATFAATHAMAASHAAVQPAKFTYLPPGWHAFDQTGTHLDRRGADVQSYALSWTYTPNSRGWANDMPPNGIAIQAILVRRDPAHPAANLCGSAPHLAGYSSRLALPLRLPATTQSTLEGQPAVREYRILGRLNNQYNVDLRVSMNRAHPTPAMLRVAQRIVSGMRFPRWPLSADC